MVIHGLLVTCFRSLCLDFQLLEMVVCVCVFENALKKMPCLGNRCNNSLLECLQRCLSFRKDISMFLEIVLKVFLKVYCGVGFEK